LETSSQENYFVACEIFNSYTDKKEKQFNCLIKPTMYQIWGIKKLKLATHFTNCDIFQNVNKKYLIIKCKVPLELFINKE